MRERDHPLLREPHVDTSIWSPDVVLADNAAWAEDVEGGWPNDGRSLARRLGQVLAFGALQIGIVLLTFVVIAWLFD